MKTIKQRSVIHTSKHPILLSTPRMTVDFPFNIGAISQNNTAITVDGHAYSYADLKKSIITREPTMARKNIVFWIDEGTYDTLITYLTCLNVKTCIGIMPRGTNSSTFNHFTSLTTRARPSLLLTTSGSTDNKKFVKLTYENLMSNCLAIGKSLPIKNTDIAGLVLSMSYSYGLSVINTHLIVGAHIYVVSAPFGSQRFWQELDENHVTSLALVPSHLTLLKQGSFERYIPKSLRYITIAGGLLDRTGQRILEIFRTLGVETYVMYGQTEATARLTCLPSEKFNSKLGSVGRSIDGVLTIDPSTLEIIYEGPNVFAGYATVSNDLLVLDKPHVLHTGDTGRMDEEGYLWVTNRLNRIAKINSQRVSLDDLEQQLTAYYGVLIKCVSNNRLVFCCSVDNVYVDIPRPDDVLMGNLTMVKIPAFPMTSSQKFDYVKLLEMVCPIK